MIPVIDGHNDLAWASRLTRGYRVDGLEGPTGPDSSAARLHTDIPRLRAGGVAGQFWSVWVDPVLRGAEQVTATLEQIDFVHRMVEAHPGDLALARTAGQVRQVMADGRIACLIGVEGAPRSTDRRRCCGPTPGPAPGT